MLRNMVQSNIRSVKRHYMIDKIDRNKDNPKQLWTYLKIRVYQLKSEESTNIGLDVDGVKWHYQKDVTDLFNQFKPIQFKFYFNIYKHLKSNRTYTKKNNTIQMILGRCFCFVFISAF